MAPETTGRARRAPRPRTHTRDGREGRLHRQGPTRRTLRAPDTVEVTQGLPKHSRTDAPVTIATRSASTRRRAWLAPDTTASTLWLRRPDASARPHPEEQQLQPAAPAVRGNAGGTRQPQRELLGVHAAQLQAGEAAAHADAAEIRPKYPRAESERQVLTQEAGVRKGKREWTATLAGALRPPVASGKHRPRPSPTARDGRSASARQPGDRSTRG